MASIRSMLHKLLISPMTHSLWVALWGATHHLSICSPLWFHLYSLMWSHRLNKENLTYNHNWPISVIATLWNGRVSGLSHITTNNTEKLLPLLRQTRRQILYLHIRNSMIINWLSLFQRRKVWLVHVHNIIYTQVHVYTQHNIHSSACIYTT